MRLQMQSDVTWKSIQHQLQLSKKDAVSFTADNANVMYGTHRRVFIQLLSQQPNLGKA